VDAGAFGVVESGDVVEAAEEALLLAAEEDEP
jgi:hypothetical protein